MQPFFAYMLFYRNIEIIATVDVSGAPEQLEVHSCWTTTSRATHL